MASWTCPKCSSTMPLGNKDLHVIKCMPDVRSPGSSHSSTRRRSSPRLRARPGRDSSPRGPASSSSSSSTLGSWARPPVSVSASRRHTLSPASAPQASRDPGHGQSQGQGHEWQWETSGGWVAFDPETEDLVEARFQELAATPPGGFIPDEGPDLAVDNVGASGYGYDFDLAPTRPMRQTNRRTGTSRPIRRVAVLRDSPRRPSPSPIRAPRWSSPSSPRVIALEDDESDGDISFVGSGDGGAGRRRGTTGGDVVILPTPEGARGSRRSRERREQERLDEAFAAAQSQLEQERFDEEYALALQRQMDEEQDATWAGDDGEADYGHGGWGGRGGRRDVRHSTRNQRQARGPAGGPQQGMFPDPRLLAQASLGMGVPQGFLQQLLSAGGPFGFGQGHPGGMGGFPFPGGPGAGPGAAMMGSPSTMSYDDLLALDENNVSRGLDSSQRESRTLVDKVPDDPAQLGEDNKECVICLEPFKKGESIRRLPCLHVYHKKCIDKHFRAQRRCPICRKDVCEDG